MNPNKFHSLMLIFLDNAISVTNGIFTWDKTMPEPTLKKLVYEIAFLLFVYLFIHSFIYLFFCFFLVL